MLHISHRSHDINGNRDMIRYTLPAARPAAVACLFAIVTGAFALQAFAALGGTVASVKDDQRQMQGTLRTTQGPRFTVHELEAASRATVREYVAPSGVVFGIAWQGPSQPDLRQLLGPYYQQYIDALAQRRTRRAPVTVALPGLVVQAGGHMRAFVGKAWLPPEMPPGVVSGDIQ
ncbi:MAG: DUF2844 domain-containing protein [Casimicrobiaceae bacterium]